MSQEAFPEFELSNKSLKKGQKLNLTQKKRLNNGTVIFYLYLPFCSSLLTIVFPCFFFLSHSFLLVEFAPSPFCPWTKATPTFFLLLTWIRVCVAIQRICTSRTTGQFHWSLILWQVSLLDRVQWPFRWRGVVFIVSCNVNTRLKTSWRPGSVLPLLLPLLSLPVTLSLTLWLCFYLIVGSNYFLRRLPSCERQLEKKDENKTFFTRIFTGNSGLLNLSLHFFRSNSQTVGQNRTGSSFFL